MTDRQIIFSAPMVRALLAGRKSMTRRVLKEQRHVAYPMFSGGRWQWHGTTSAVLSDVVVPYAPGDRLWVREAWRFDAEWDDFPPRYFDGADAVHYEAGGAQDKSLWGDPFRPGRLRSPIHMPRWASRLTLVVTNVRVQRLQEITSADAISEGCSPYANSATIDCDTPNPRDDFKRLWNSIHGTGAWDRNPWVAAISFKVHRCNIDTMEEGTW